MSPVDRQGGEPTEREWLEGLRYEDKFPAQDGEARNHEGTSNVGASSARSNIQARNLGRSSQDEDHETEVEAVARAIYDTQENGIAWDSETLGDWRKDYEREKAQAAIAALDAVRCAQGRDTDAPEHPGEDRFGSYMCPRCGRTAVTPARHTCPQGEDHETLRSGTASDRFYMHSTHQRPMAGCEYCERECRSPQGEDHEAMEDATAAFSDASGWHLYPQIRRGLAAALPHLSRCPSPEREIDRLRAGISFVRGLCTDRVPYAVIDERLGELLDGETT